MNSNTVLTEDSFRDLEDDIYNFDGLTNPVSVSYIVKFKRLHPNVSLNVFEVGDKSEITPLRVVKEKDYRTDLLLHRCIGAAHYVLITPNL